MIAPRGLEEIFGHDALLTQDAIGPEYAHDESLVSIPVTPSAVVFPQRTEQVAQLIAWARTTRTPVVARGGGTGLSGGATPVPGSVVCSLSRMTEIREINAAGGYARCEPGVTLADLEALLLANKLVYPIYPGEHASTIGGNAATNAGGMRAVKYGITRNNILGLTAVTGTGEIISTGSSTHKSSSGYDLTQLLIGSEGTLAIITEVTTRLKPLLEAKATVLLPFPSIRAITEAVPAVLMSGVEPSVCEYIDSRSLDVMSARVGLRLGIRAQVKARTQAYLVVICESFSDTVVEAMVAKVTEICSDFGGLDAYVLAGSQAELLLSAREAAFWVSKELGATDILDIAVPRSCIADFMDAVTRIETIYESPIAGAGHIGDGNIHLSLFEHDPARRHEICGELIKIGIAMGGVVSGEHGIGTDKLFYQPLYRKPEIQAIMSALKDQLDPDHILNPGKVLS